MIMAVLVSLLLSSCQPASKSDQAPQSADEEAAQRAELAKSDVSELASAPDVSSDSLSGKAFVKIFGGVSGRDVFHFLNERMKKIVSSDDAIQLLTNDGKNIEKTSWAVQPDFNERLKKAGAEVKAANLGAVIFLAGVINNVDLKIRFADGETVEADSPRVGLIQLGSGYRAKLVQKNGEAAGGEQKIWQDFKGIKLPSVIRQATLLHEARHSDCTGGLTATDLEPVRDATSYETFVRDFKKPQCTHFHVICPEDHSLAGLPACDALPWGAYSVDLIYLAAKLATFKASDGDAISESEGGHVAMQLIEAAAADRISRLTFSAEDMLNEKMGEPDMSSGEFKK